MSTKCGKCQKVMDVEKFGYKKDGTQYRRCISCREKENRSYVKSTKSFVEEYPELEKEWDYERNNEKKIYPENISSGSGKKVWWLCSIGNSCHRWESSLNRRTKKNKPNGCPFCFNKKICECGCNSLWEKSPDLREEWDEEKNGSMKLYSPNTPKKVWWLCSTKNPCHRWECSISDRAGRKSMGCPFCINRQICECGCNSLWGNSPDLREEWDEEKNGSMKSYAPNTPKKVWWLCSTRNPCHRWEVGLE